MGGGFITAAAPLLIFNFGTGISYAVGFVSILIAVGIAFFSGWIHKPKR